MNEEEIKQWVSSLESEDNKKLLLVASMIINLAIRPRDIANLTAKNFVRRTIDPYVHLVYEPHKTYKSNNRIVDWPICDALWGMICAVAGDRLREGEAILADTPSVCARLNELFRARFKCSCSFDKELRHFAILNVMRELGIDAAVAFSGYCSKWLMSRFGDVYKFIPTEPIEIMPMPDVRTLDRIHAKASREAKSRRAKRK